MPEPEKSREELLTENSLFLQQISDMSSSAHEMIKSQSHLESVLLNAAEGIILFNPDGTVKSLNLAAQKIFGYQEVELMYQHIPHLFNAPAEYNENVPAYLKHYLIEHPDTQKEPLSGCNNKGQIIPLHLSVSEVSASEMVFFDDFSDENETEVKDAYELFACLIHDLSSEIEAKKNLQKKNIQLEQAYISLSEHDRLRSEFLAKISHELLTPLNGIIGMADLLQEEVQQDQQEYIQVIRESGLRLEGIINNILAFDNNNEQMKEETSLDLVQLLRSYEEKFGTILLTKKLNLSIDIDNIDDIPIFYTMSMHLQHILDNLIDNALKFTHSGNIYLRLNVSPYDNIFHKVILVIQDTGIGISKSDQEKIFDPFTQLESTVTRQFGGVGMGLAIVKQLINGLDGQLDLQSEPDKGTIVTITLLLKTADEEMQIHCPVDKEKLKQLKELLEDDFKLLITTSINELHNHYKELFSHIKKQDDKSVFSSFTLLKNIADQLGSKYLINKLEELYSFYEKKQQSDASEEKFKVFFEEISEEIKTIEKALKPYQ